MPDELKKVVRQVTWRIAVLMAAGNLLILIGWLIAYKSFHVGPTAAMLIMTGGALVLTWVFSSAAAEYANEPVLVLWQALMHVAPKASNVPAPVLEQVDLGRELLSTMVGYIYDLASTATGLSDGAKTRESTFEATIVNMPVPIMVLDAENRIMYANPAAGSYFSLNPFGISGQQFDDVVSLSFSNENTLSNWLHDCQTNRISDTTSWERVRTTPPGASTPIQFDMAAHFSKNDSHGVETVLVFFDHTKLYEMDDHDISFVAMAVHELRTPLTIMRGYIEVFEDELAGKLDAEQKQFMYNMHAFAQQLTSIVSNILKVARIEENQMDVQLRKEDWQDVLMGACKDMELRARVHHKTFAYRIDGGLPPVAVDRVSMYEVIMNLLDNAIKYSGDKSKITVSASLKDGMVETIIEDEGIGIPDNLLSHIFDKFYRSHRSRVQIGGSGLGLYLSKQIVGAHGGQIWVKSKEGKGSSFGFTVPLFASVADNLKSGDNNNQEIVRNAHGWIKNHSFYKR